MPAQRSWTMAAMAILAAIAGAAIGALLTLVVKHWLDRSVETRAARREFYVELLTMLHAGKRALEHVSFAVTDPVPDLVAGDRIDEFNARLELDASETMRKLVVECFRLLHQFSVSSLTRVPVEVDAEGMFDYRSDLIMDQSDEGRRLQMRMALGAISREYQLALEKVTTQIRREVHAVV